MQSDAEARPEVPRDFDEDVRLMGAVPGVDVFIGGHAHRGIEVPYVHPKTGTIIVQTYGYGTRLGYLRLRLRAGKVAAHSGELMKVWTDSIAPDSAVLAVVDRYKRETASRSGEPVLTLSRRLYRKYNEESPLGNAIADAMRFVTGAEIAFQNAGGIRADLPEGLITTGHILDVLPFVNTTDTYRLTGAQVKEVLEQSLTLERGMMQVAGLRVEYDLSKPAGSRVVRAWVGRKPLVPTRSYLVATSSFIGQGGDLYSTFNHATRITEGPTNSDVLTSYLRRVGEKAVIPREPWVATRLISVGGRR